MLITNAPTGRDIDQRRKNSGVQWIDYQSRAYVTGMTSAEIENGSCVIIMKKTKAVTVLSSSRLMKMGPDCIICLRVCSYRRDNGKVWKLKSINNGRVAQSNSRSSGRLEVKVE